MADHTTYPVPGRYYTSNSCTHSEIDASRELSMNRDILTSYCICGVRWFVHYKVLTSASTMVHLLMASKSSSLPPFLHHCTAVVDMTVVTAKNRLHLIYLDTEQHLFSDLPYWFSDGKHSSVVLFVEERCL